LADGRSRAAALYRTYGPAVYRRCLRLLQDPDEARDATQDVFVKLVRDMDRLEDEMALPWIYRVATNHCLNLLRSLRRRGVEVDASDEALELHPSYEAAYPARALARSLLARFDGGTQVVALGILVDGMEQEELARALGISRKTVQRRLARFLEGARALIAGGES
jgi:RNA polymerase sigma-70 factor, ECF subfamily